jgi:Novel STAND NTPase 1
VVVTDFDIFLSHNSADKAFVESLAQKLQSKGLNPWLGVVDKILNDVANQPGALPLLEHALLELWKRRQGRTLTLEGYRESGGVTGAIAKTAEESFNGFSASEQRIVRRIMLRLTQLGEGTEDTRRRAKFEELVTTPEETEVVERIVRAMVDAHLLTTSGA